MNLEVLLFGGNQIRSLPDDLSHWKQLTTFEVPSLSLFFNSLSALFYLVF